MSHENVELTRRAFDAFNKRNLDAYLALMDEDVEVVSRLVAMEGSFHGHDGICRWWQTLFDVWPDYTAQVVEMRDLGDLTITAAQMEGHGAGSDIPSQETIWQVARLRRGKCVWWGTYSTRDEALEAVGQSE
jgi:ketosteroid isomerase-like protein